MKIITYATDYSHNNIKLLQQKLSIELIPNYRSWDHNFYAKAYGVYKFIQQYSSDELILCIDGYDVLPLNGCNNNIITQQILNSFNLEKIIFNAEINCYPNSDLQYLYPKHDSKWKYLNAGIFCGIQKNIIRMYELVLDNIKNSMDQLQLSILFIQSNLISLDYNCDVFQTLYNGTVGGGINMDDFIFISKNKYIINKLYNTRPLLFHGNGKINMSTLGPYL